MRLIGHLTTESGARLFGDYLYAQGIENRVEPQGAEGWAIWVVDEDKLENAASLLAEYRLKPDAPEYQAQAKSAAALRAEQAKDQEAYRRRLRSRRQLFRPLAAYGFGPLTFVLIAASVAVFVVSGFAANKQRIMSLFITDYWITGLYINWDTTLPEIRHGQVWRLVTPVFIHMDILHILFNMLWLRDLGSMIEGRQSSIHLGAIVVVTAILSNLGQFYFGHMPSLSNLASFAHLSSYRGGPDFGGMSGVLYGLLGYIWLRGKFDPGSGLFLHQSTVIMMLVWLVLCYTGWLGNIANGAHTFGLLVGMAWGYLSSLRYR
jgi:GlpG protein